MRGSPPLSSAIGSFRIQGTCSGIPPRTILCPGAVRSRYWSGSDRAGNDLGGRLGYLETPHRASRRRSHPEEWLGVEVCILLSDRGDPNPKSFSRAEALQSFKKNPFFANWDSLSLELYVECQFWENKETREAKLKMSGTWVGDRTLWIVVSWC